MLTYYITFAIVLALCFLAEYYDYAYDNSISYGRVYHSQITRIFFAGAIIVLSWVAGSRYYVGADFGAYFSDDCSMADVIEKLVNFDEPGYYFLSVIGRSIWHTNQANIMIAAFASITIAMIVLYRNTNCLLFASMLFCFDWWNGCFNGIRQYLAAAVLFAGFAFIRDKKLWKYAIVVFLAFLCHRSAAVMIVPYFISHWKVNWKRLIVIIVGAAVILYSYERLFELAGWIMNQEEATDAYAMTVVNKWRVIAGCAPAVFFIIAYWKREKTEAENFYINLLTFHAVARVITMNSAFLYRIGIYTSLFQMIAIPELMKGFSDGDRKVISVGILLLFGILWWWEAVNSTALNPFRWYW